MKTYEIRTATLSEQPTAVMRATLTVEEIRDWIGSAFHATATAVTAQGSFFVGPPFTRYHMLEEGRFEVEAGFPIGKPIKAEGDVEPSTISAGEVATTTHFGPYDRLGDAYEALAAWIAERGGTPAGDPWEVYLTSPDESPDPEHWRTEVTMPYRPA